MNSRTRIILKKSVRDFINTGRPITSEYLYETYDFGIKPAMIRRELSILDDSGYLEQIHTSGGRLPTNKAYKYFVSSVLKKDDLLSDFLDDSVDILETLISGEINTFTRNLSNQLKSLSVLYEIEKQLVHDSGLENLFREIEWEDKSDLLEIIRDLELLPNKLKKSKLINKRGCWHKVFIGKSPITKSDRLSMVVSKIKTKNGDQVVMVIGPRRMDYEKALGILKSLENLIEKNERR
ncbi:MAG: hypothetical protein WDZ80_06020 [Candidatus Paceibacterota bacterium]